MLLLQKLTFLNWIQTFHKCRKFENDIFIMNNIYFINKMRYQQIYKARYICRYLIICIRMYTSIFLRTTITFINAI